MPEGAAACQPTVACDPDCEREARIAALRQRGAERFDPVRFSLIESLARRLPAQPEAVKQLLTGKLDQLLDDYLAGVERAQSEVREAANGAAAEFPESADELYRLSNTVDATALRRLVAKLKNEGAVAPLVGLVRYLAQQSSNEGRPPGADLDGMTVTEEREGEAPGELKSLRYFRSTWSKLSVEQQLGTALTQGPENAGPLNSHRLVLQSLKRLNDLSPDYLNRLMRYVDALLWLDQNTGGPVIRKSVAGVESDKKRKPSGRAKSSKPQAPGAA